MRLICPNCDAEYEVDDAAIPKEGRDVQCSACGHAWFQAHPEVEAEAEAEAELYEPPEGAIEPAEPLPEPEPEPVVEPAPVAPTAEPPKPRGLDETVLAVLKEEAEREAQARKAEAMARPGLESQTEMPLPAAAPVAPAFAPAPAFAAAPAEEPAPAAAAASNAGSMVSAVKRIAKLRGVAPEDEAEEEAPAPVKSRRPEFPAIEEINQTLRATGDRSQNNGDAVVDTLSGTEAGRGGFRRGFVLLVALAVLALVLYVFAPVIAARVPALEGAARAYVAAVDAARLWLDGTLRGLITWLRGLAGSQG